MNDFTKTHEEKDLIWVPKSIAKKLDQIESGDFAEQYILEYAKRLRLSIECSIEALDEDIIQLKAKGIAYKQAYKAAFDEEEAAITDLWELSQARGAEAKKQATRQTQEIRNLAESLTEAVQALETTLNQINNYTIKEACETVERVKSAVTSLTPEVKHALKGILNETNN